MYIYCYRKEDGYIADDIEIYSDNSDEENSDEENSNVEN